MSKAKPCSSKLPFYSISANAEQTLNSSEALIHSLHMINKSDQKMENMNQQNVNVQDIMQGHKTVCLQHGERKYCLSITRKGNLILTKAEEEQEKQMLEVES